MNYKEYARRIEGLLGTIGAADRIDEALWTDTFMKELSELSRDAAGELQSEVGLVWRKDTYDLALHEAPPTRVLALVITLAAWLGWIMREKHGEGDAKLSAPDCLQRIQTAYDWGVNLSRRGERP